MRRFYIRIYFALFASLVVFAVLAGTTAGMLRLFDERPARSWPEASAEIAERLWQTAIASRSHPSSRSGASEAASTLPWWPLPET
jgi:hypothetical protein